MVEDGPSISVIVCAFANERKEQLEAALQSILQQETAAFEVVAVIDHNEDLQRSIAASYRDVKVVANTGLQGLSGGRNTGMKLARGNIVAFLDDDAYASRNWLTQMLSHYRDPAVIGVGGGIIPIWPGKRPGWFPGEFNWVIGCSYTGLPSTVAPVRNPIGCNMSFRRILYDHIGGFREDIGRVTSSAEGCEETDFFIRARQAFPQSIVLYDPNMKVHHHVSTDRTRWKYFRKRCIAEGGSKTLVVEQLGSDLGLSAERNYVTQVLPAGVARCLGDTLFRFDWWGVARAFSIVAGLGYTTGGYVKSRLARGSKSRTRLDLFRPIKIIDVDIDCPLEDVAMVQPATGLRYGGVFCLIRKRHRPIGVVEFAHMGNVLPAKLLQSKIRVSTYPTTVQGSNFGKPGDAGAKRATGKDQFVTVVVATRDRPESLARCLNSLLGQTYPNFDILVVDNAPSSSATAQLIESHYGQNGKVRYIREDRPGLGRAHHSGIAHVHAAYALFTDDDVIADPQWIGAMVSNFDAAGRVGCVTGLILPAELETRAQFWTERHGGFSKGFERRVFDLEDNRPADRLFPFTAGQFGSGANMAFSMAALRWIGGFDTALGAGTIARGGDDIASFYAVVKAGFQLVYEPDAIVWHHHRRGEDGMNAQAFCYGSGLGAYLTKIVMEEPATALRLLSLLPSGLAHMAGPSSAKNRRLPAEYPASLVWRERFGILAGVPGYLRSRVAAGRAPDGRVAVPESPAIESVRG